MNWQEFGRTGEIYYPELAKKLNIPGLRLRGPSPLTFKQKVELVHAANSDPVIRRDTSDGR